MAAAAAAHAQEGLRLQGIDLTCEYGRVGLRLELRNDMAVLLDAISLDLTLHDSGGDQRGIASVSFRYVDPGRTAPAKASFDTSCGGRFHVKLRAVGFCRMAGKAIRDCDSVLSPKLNQTVGWRPPPAPAAKAPLAAAPAAPKQPLVGEATIIDGDTLAISGKRIRLIAIDAFEISQTCQRTGGDWACGEAAKQRLFELTWRGAPVRCTPSGGTSYGRILARCTAASPRKGEPDIDLSETLVQEGLALADPKRPEYRAAETSAKLGRRGAHDGQFMPPWLWRLEIGRKK